MTAVARILSPKYGMSVDAVRKCLARSNTVENRLWLSEQMATPQDTSPGVRRQKEVISESEQTFKANQSRLSALNQGSSALFISDRHIPLHRKDAWELTLQIMEDIPNLEYVSALNDWSDLKGWSLKWDDSRPSYERIWSDDVQYADSMEMNDYQTILLSNPGVKLLGLMGNHDMWRYKKYRAQLPQSAERDIATHMETLLDIGVLQFSRGRQENVIQLSPGLTWLHGIFAAKTSVSNARNTMAMLVEQGRPPSNVVFGHTHRASITHGHQIGYKSIKVVNSPSLCKNTGFDYLRLGKSNTWTLGVTVSTFHPQKWYTHIELVEYEEERGKLITHYNGKSYSVPIDKD